MAVLPLSSFYSAVSVFRLECAALGFTALAGLVAALTADHNFICGAGGFPFVIYAVADVTFDFVHFVCLLSTVVFEFSLHLCINEVINNVNFCYRRYAFVLFN